MKLTKKDLIQFKVCNEAGRLSPAILRLPSQNPSLAQRIVEETSFIQYDANLKVRAQFIIQGISYQPRCKVCNAVLKMAVSGPKVNTIGTYCGARCAVKDPDIKEQKRQTNIQKYGTEEVLSNPSIREKCKDTMIKKYGVVNPMDSPHIKASRDATNLERYGDVHTLKVASIREKIAQTNLKKYGAVNPLLNPNIRQKGKATNIARLGVDNPFKLPEIQEKADDMRLSGQQKYGHTHYHSSCIHPRSLELLNDPVWLNEQHVNHNLTLHQIAQILEVGENVVQQRFRQFDLPIITIPYYQDE